MVVQASQENFKTVVAEGVTLVDFWAPWCGPCRALAPILDEVSAELGDTAKVVKINTDENIPLAQEYRISSIPALLLFKDGQVVDQAVGVKQKQELIDWVKKHA
ncbi:MAG: thioredoxin [Vampirovibrionales bacterium]